MASNLVSSSGHAGSWRGFLKSGPLITNLVDGKFDMDSSQNSRYLFDLHRKIDLIAEERGLIAIKSAVNLLQLDLDGEFAKAQHPELLKMFQDVFPDVVIPNGILTTVSQHGGLHVYLVTHRNFNERERISYQLMLGSDPKREILNLKRMTNHDGLALITLFETPANAILVSQFLHQFGVTLDLSQCARIAGLLPKERKSVNKLPEHLLIRRPTKILQLSRGVLAQLWFWLIGQPERAFTNVELESKMVHVKEFCPRCIKMHQRAIKKRLGKERRNAEKNITSSSS